MKPESCDKSKLSNGSIMMGKVRNRRSTKEWFCQPCALKRVCDNPSMVENEDEFKAYERYSEKQLKDML